MKEEKGIGASPQIFWPRTALGCSSVACRDAPLLSYIAFNSPQRRSVGAPAAQSRPVRLKHVRTQRRVLSEAAGFRFMGILQLRFEHDSSTIRARHASARYEVFRALAYEIDSSTPRESVVGVSCMLIDSSMHTAFTLYLYRPTLHRVCEYARNCLYKRN